MTPPSIHHHVYTSSTDGSLGAPGFQTLASDPGLAADTSLLAAVEQAVAELRPPAALGEHACRQITVHHRAPGGSEARVWIVTRSTAVGRTPDQRQGNFWAESFVVPETSLPVGPWDPDALFEALPWIGPTLGETPKLESLSADRLAGLRETPLQRLDWISRDLSAERRRALVEAVVGLRPSRAPLAVSPPDGWDPATWEERLPHLLLLLPPSCRSVYGHDGSLRRAGFRTLGEPGRGVEVDLLGLLPGASPPSRFDGRRLDLGQGFKGQQLVLPEEQHLAYVDRLMQILELRDWDALDTLYRRHREPTLPTGDELRALDPTTEASPAPVKAPTPARATEIPPSTSLQRTVHDRKRIWNFREKAESMMDDLDQRLETELSSLRKHFKEELTSRVADHLQEMEGIKTRISREIQELESVVDDKLRELENLKSRHQKALDATSKALRQELDEAARAHKEALGAEKESLITRLFSSDKPSKTKRKSSKKGKKTPRRPSLWLQENRAATALLGTSVLFAVVALVWWQAWNRAEDPIGDGTELPSTSTAELETLSRQEVDAMMSQVREAAVSPTAAKELVTWARTRADLEKEALSLLVASRLQDMEELSKQDTCALLQGAISYYRSDFTVDGDCGPGTARAARTLVNGWREEDQQAPLVPGPDLISAQTAPRVLATDGPAVLKQYLGLTLSCNPTWTTLETRRPCLLESPMWADVVAKAGPGFSEEARGLDSLEGPWVFGEAPPELQDRLVELLRQKCTSSALQDVDAALTLRELAAKDTRAFRTRVNELLECARQGSGG